MIRRKQRRYPFGGPRSGRALLLSLSLLSLERTGATAGCRARSETSMNPAGTRFWRTTGARALPRQKMKKIAKTLQAHRQRILNRFRARGMISTDTVEGMSSGSKSSREGRTDFGPIVQSMLPSTIRWESSRSAGPIRP